MNPSVTFVISTMLDIYRPELKKRYGERYKGEYSAEWSRNRIDFFRGWTLKSLQNQTFQDFTILMFCHENSRDLIESYEWDDNIRHCYDYGDAAFSEIDTGFISITRMDTDDLLHRDGMALIARNFSETKRRGKFLFSDYYSCLFHHGIFIHRLNPLSVVKGARWSPGYTLILPNGADVRKEWFICPVDMCRKPYLVIGSDMICDIKIDGSTHYQIWNNKAASYKILKESTGWAKKRGEEIITSTDKQVEILSDFGITKEQYQNV